MAYGAYKPQSRLRLGSEPFTWSAVHLYHNPVPQELQGHGARDPRFFRRAPGRPVPPGRRIALGGGHPEVLRRRRDGRRPVRALPRIPRSARECRRRAVESYVTMQFLWRFLALAGYQPDDRHLRLLRRRRWVNAGLPGTGRVRMSCSAPRAALTRACRCRRARCDTSVPPRRCR